MRMHRKIIFIEKGFYMLYMDICYAMMSLEEVAVSILLFAWVIFVATVLAKKLYGFEKPRC